MIPSFNNPFHFIISHAIQYGQSHTLKMKPIVSLFKCMSTLHSNNSTGILEKKKVTTQRLLYMYLKHEPITMITAHDYPSALFVDKSGADMLLVGDSLAMVALGYDSTVSVTMDEMLHHCRAVSRGAKRPFLIGDMPFGSYEFCKTSAVKNAFRMMKEGNMDAVKLEGGKEMAETVKAMSRVGIPVIGHIGLTPQRIASLGGFRVQGKTAVKAIQLLDDATTLQEAGAFAIVLEAIPAPIASHITSSLRIPTIGIGAGVGCSGQVLVQQDMLGIFDRFVPKFCKQYASVTDIITSALKEYCMEVKTSQFPKKEHTYTMPEEELNAYFEAVSQSKSNKN